MCIYISQLQKSYNTSMWNSPLYGEAMQVVEHLKLHFFLMCLLKWIANGMHDFGQQWIAIC